MVIILTSEYKNIIHLVIGCSESSELATIAANFVINPQQSFQNPIYLSAYELLLSASSHISLHFHQF